MSRSLRGSRSARGALGQSALTPLLDTLFLLLFALLASSRSALVEDSPRAQEVQVELPAVEDLAREPGGDAEVRRVVVRVGADGSVALLEEGEPAPLDTVADLRAAFARVLGDDPDGVILEIHADADARHGLTVDVLQAARAAGLMDVRFVARADSGGGARPLGGSRGGER